MHLIITQPPESDELSWTKIKRQAQRIGHHIEQQGDKIVKVVAEIAVRPLAVKMVKAAGGTGEQVSLLTRPEKYVDELLSADSFNGVSVSHIAADHEVTVWCMSNQFFEKHIFDKF